MAPVVRQGRLHRFAGEIVVGGHAVDIAVHHAQVADKCPDRDLGIYQPRFGYTAFAGVLLDVPGDERLIRYDHRPLTFMPRRAREMVIPLPKV